MTATIEERPATVSPAFETLQTNPAEIPASLTVTNIVIAICRHCQKKKANRPRGLCWQCYFTPGVKNLHPSTSKYGRRGVGNMNRNRLPDEPTEAPPGSEAKLAILADRARKNLSLWHPNDARYPGDRQPDEALAGN
jgi:hypothetical protein